MNTYCELNMQMNKLDEVFLSGKKNLLNVYCTAGYPEIQSTAEVILSLQGAGADMVEIGMPYSDPIADGPVIQESNMIALSNGMNMQLLFEQLDAVKKEVLIPVILMGYLNPVLQYGMSKFCLKAQNAGVSAVIIPDLPIYEFEHCYKELFRQHDLHFIFLVTSETGKKRLKKLDSLSNGFLYCVSSSSTTGGDNPDFHEDQFKWLSKVKLKNPVMIGFGIKDKGSFKLAGKFSNGAIIGSAYIRALKKGEDIALNTNRFIDSILH